MFVAFLALYFPLLSWNCFNRFETVMRTVFLHGAAIIYSGIQRIVTQESFSRGKSRNGKSILARGKSSLCSRVA